jgi:hypothetical protein
LKIKLENLQFMHAGADDSNDPTKALLAENMPLLLNTAWSLSALDIESSVSVMLVLGDVHARGWVCCLCYALGRCRCWLL